MTINCKGQLIDLSQPKVMGILNVTPDSFFDGNQDIKDSDIVAKAQNMLHDGADFIDVGGYSTRPNANFVSEEEELERVIRAVKLLTKHFPELIISVDTFRSHVAEQAILHGASIINDISAGLLDNNMLFVAAKYQVPYIMMHMKGTPQTMTQHTDYQDIIKEMMYYFSERVAVARSVGINDIILDVGFGFAKTIPQNFEILNQLEHFSWLELPLLVGVSRKSMIYKTLNITPQEALNGTTVLHTIAIQKGASILRVHDVKEAVQSIKLINSLKS
ncbi:dihydropteroate synthase [Flavobacterium croceum]|uniref:Dihydropteroate synthase n=1 Tax=Flavobacterium croceum DSM 17960 TaxID=1121886 RepID=A0A2S4NAV2_9FLAO|nr:dihydropteroate synthase [Flavobacterium croceum]POS02827.1 dihydropteroate synthase [Flavobacterium croceum DSM 17960]